ncbi:ABC transporter ATP-binding protein [Kitasatospora sp. NPDC059327]|uniref:ABC transporter ATP-binding protein n=1 Tax=Kitasatospora sp. NPDC059327 TaxID=3346803 RepID=UPI0036A5D70C
MDGRAAAAGPASAGYLLSVRDLRVVIDGSHILHGVDLDVATTGVTALLGRNGAGKTTTVRAVMGLVPRTGSVLFDGTELSSLPTHLVVRQGIGYAPEDRGIFAGLTVAENLRLAERSRSRSRSRGRDQDRGRGRDRDRDSEPDYHLVHELFPELKQRAGQLAGTLSGGQQQMVAIGRTLLNRNRLIIADEPTKGLAPKIVAEVADVLARAAEAVPVLLVEQNLALVRRLAGACVVLADGRAAHRGDTAELLADEEAARRLLGVGSHRPGAGSSAAPAGLSEGGPDPAAAPVTPEVNP